MHRKNLKKLTSFGLLTTILIILYVTFPFSLPSFYGFNYMNRTLGFGHIYVINLAHRADRRHNMEAIANVLNLDFDYFTAISSDDSITLNNEEYKGTILAPTHKACYLSHYKVWELIARSGYESALILEDDVDFEMDISRIAYKVHRDLPYDWEMVYLGHCTDEGTDSFRFIRRWFDDSYTSLFKSQVPACTHAYAVSSLGVSKILKDIVNLSDPVDVELVYRVQDGTIASYSLEPSAIVQWKSYDNPSDVSPGTMDYMWPLRNSTMRFLGLIE